MFSLQGVTAGYGDSVVLRDVTLSVPRGRVAALLGPNGAGKTTLLRVASGLLPLRSGTVTIDDGRLDGKPTHVFTRRGICHVPEGRGIFRSLSVRENLLAQSRGAPDAIERAVDAFPRLGERLEQVAGTMSGGEQQMLALARAYTTSPDIVFLDEVSLGLAPKVVDEIFEFLRRLADKGCALLLVEQYVARALDLADFVYILDQGQIAFAGETAEVDQDALFRTYTGVDA